MENPEPLPRNPIYPWLRVMLWILPAGFMIIGSALIGAVVSSIFRNDVVATTACVVGNVLFLIGTGWCDYQLSPPDRKKSTGVGSAVTLFFFSQILLAPFIVILVGLAFCAVIR